MPRPNTITVSFSKKNSDIKELLDGKKKDEKFEQSQYICDAIRFYEKNKNKSFGNNISADEVRKIVDERFEELKKQLLNNETVIDIDNEKQKFNNEVLEENINNIDPMFLADD